MSEIYRFAGLELDTSQFQVRRNGQVLPVQPQVFDVLLYLLKNHDRVVSKDELLDQVWSGRFISETTLSSRIKAVRKLIGDTGKDQKLIKTLRNRGFRFVGDVAVALSDAQRLTATPPTTRSDVSGTSIAVLPFECPGGDPEQLYLGEGIAADIISLLARHRWLTVIARGSSFMFRVGETTPQQIGAAVGVGFLLTGRVRRHGGRIRIDAELADCDSGRHLWGESFDKDESDVFAVQEEIAERIAATIEPELGQIVRQRVIRKEDADLDAWDCCQRGFWHLYRFTVDDLHAARQWFVRALQINDELPRAHGGLAYVAIQLAFYGSPAKRPAELEAALAASQRAVETDPWNTFSRFVRGRALSLVLNFPESKAQLESAIELNPSFAQAYFALGFCLTNWDRAEEAMPYYDKAVQLSPRDPHIWTFHHMRSMAHFRLGEMAEAEHYVRAAVRQPNATYWPFATLAALLGDLGKIEEATAVADRLTRMKPGYTLSYARQDFFYTQPGEFVERYIRGLERAGIPAGAG
jgi:TolB-like protein